MTQKKLNPITKMSPPKPPKCSSDTASYISRELVKTEPPARVAGHSDSNPLGGMMPQPRYHKAESNVRRRLGSLPLTQTAESTQGEASLERGTHINLLNFKRYSLCLFFFFLILVHLFIEVKQVRGDVRFTLWVRHPGSGRPTTAFSSLGNL